MMYESEFVDKMIKLKMLLPKPKFLLLYLELFFKFKPESCFKPKVV